MDTEGQAAGALLASAACHTHAPQHNEQPAEAHPAARRMVPVPLAAGSEVMCTQPNTVVTASGTAAARSVPLRADGAAAEAGRGG